MKLTKLDYNGKDLDIATEPFGGNAFLENLTEMRKRRSLIYKDNEEFSFEGFFRAATTAESIFITSRRLKEMEGKVFHSRFLQAGLILNCSEGVFVNLPVDMDGMPVSSEGILKKYLDGMKKVKGIYLGRNDFGFAPYDSFARGAVSRDDFVRGGLARVMEHTEESVAENFEKVIKSFSSVPLVKVTEIGLNSFCRLGVLVFGPARGPWRGQFFVSGDSSGGLGYAYGILDQLS